MPASRTRNMTRNWGLHRGRLIQTKSGWPGTSPTQLTGAWWEPFQPWKVEVACPSPTSCQWSMALWATQPEFPTSTSQTTTRAWRTWRGTITCQSPWASLKPGSVPITTLIPRVPCAPGSLWAAGLSGSLMKMSWALRKTLSFRGIPRWKLGSLLMCFMWQSWKLTLFGWLIFMGELRLLILKTILLYQCKLSAKYLYVIYLNCFIFRWSITK